MRISSTLKVRAEKKTVAVKWRDNAWYPRIVIRSMGRRGPSLGFWEDSALTPGADGCSQGVAVRLRRLGRAGGPSFNSGRCEISDTRTPFVYGRSRFLPGSRLDNPL